MMLSNEMERKRIERHVLSEEGWLRVIHFPSKHLGYDVSGNGDISFNSSPLQHLGHDVFVFGRGNRRIAWDPIDQVIVLEYEYEV